MSVVLPMYFSSASWGPVWGGNKVAFGYAQGSGDTQTTRVDFYATEPTLWP